MQWRAWFTEDRRRRESRFNSRDHEPDKLPRDGVLGVVKYKPERTQAGKPYREILSGYDHYFWWKGEWFGNSDTRKEIKRRYPGALILRGKWTTDAEMQRVQGEMARAREEP